LRRSSLSQWCSTNGRKRQRNWYCPYMHELPYSVWKIYMKVLFHWINFLNRIYIMKRCIFF
jgi:hypothetical protein